jgi:hypothetical protein
MSFITTTLRDCNMLTYSFIHAAQIHMAARCCRVPADCCLGAFLLSTPPTETDLQGHAKWVQVSASEQHVVWQCWLTEPLGTVRCPARTTKVCIWKCWSVLQVVEMNTDRFFFSYFPSLALQSIWKIQICLTGSHPLTSYLGCYSLSLTSIK